jgi:hypothetical protein
MVVSTAVGPVVLGAALEAGVGLAVMGWATIAYVILVPWLLVPGPRAGRGP